MARQDLFDPSTLPQLRPWLTKALEPICDADPAVLSDYVLALLKHDSPEAELRSMLISQLQDFLDKEASPFVEKLFQTLRTRSYLPYEVNTAAGDTGIHIPLDALLSPSNSNDRRGLKRGADFDDSAPSSSRGPPKGPRLSQEHSNRHAPPNGRGPPPPTGPNPNRNGNGNGFRGPSAGPGPSNGPRNNGPPYQNGAGPSGSGYGRGPPSGPADRPNLPLKTTPKEQCRDYHNIGFCPRGEMCPYSHGEEAIVPPMPFPSGPNGMPFNSMQMMGMMQNGFQMPWMMEQPYDPNEARMDISTPLHGNGNRHNRRADQGFRHTTDAVDLTNHNNSGPPSNPMITDLTPQTIPTFMRNGNGFPSNNDLPPQHMNNSPRQNGFIPPSSNNVPHNNAPPPQFGSSDGGMGQQGRGGFPRRDGGGRGGGGGGRPPRGRPNGEPGSFGGEVLRDATPTNSRSQNDSKTIVVERIPDEHLSLPGINTWFAKFGTVTNVAIHAPTKKALVSFETHEQAYRAWKSEDAVFGNRFVKLFWHRPLAGQGEAGHKALAASAPLVKYAAEQANAPAPQATPAVAPTPPVTAMTKEDLIARSKLLEHHIKEQKALMASLATATPEEKAEIMTKLRALSAQMSLKPAASAPKVESSGDPDVVMADGDKTQEQSDAGGDRQSQLMAQLAELRKKAAQVGVPSSEIVTPPPSEYVAPARGFTPRGRGRGRGAPFRGGARGGGPVKSLKLDNRTRKLIIKGVNLEDESLMAAVREWFKAVGELESFEGANTEEVHIQYKSRAEAEQALARGNTIPAVGTFAIGWHQPSRTTTSTLPSHSVPSDTTSAPTPTSLPLIGSQTTSDQKGSVPMDVAISGGGNALTVVKPEGTVTKKNEEEDGGGWGDDNFDE